MKKLSTFLAGMLTTILILSLTITALAAANIIEINTDIQIMVNGEIFRPKNVNGEDVLVFSYEGTTYAPVRAIAEAYGLEVGWDAETKMVTVGESVGVVEGVDMSMDVAAVPELSEMTYEEFRSIIFPSLFTIQNDEILMYPSNQVIFYYFDLSIGTNIDKDAFFEQWEYFLTLDISNQYFDTLLDEFQNKAPYNSVIVNLRHNHAIIKQLWELP